MASTAKIIATNLETYLTAQNPSESVAIQYMIDRELSDTDTRRIVIMPASYDFSREARGLDGELHQIDVGFFARIGDEADRDAAIETQLDFVQTVRDQLKDYALETTVQAVPLRLTNDPIFDPEYLSKTGIFRSALQVFYQVFQ